MITLNVEGGEIALEENCSYCDGRGFTSEDKTVRWKNPNGWYEEETRSIDSKCGGCGLDGNVMTEEGRSILSFLSKYGR